jgi:hypothetical protein
VPDGQEDCTSWMPPGPIKNRRSTWLKKAGVRNYRRAQGSPYRRVIVVSSYWWVEGNSLQYSGLFGMERGDDFFREDFGGPEDLDAQDIPRIAELDGDAWRDLNGPGNLAIVADQIEHVSLDVVSDFGCCSQL